MKKYSSHIVSFFLTLTLCFSIYSIYDCFRSPEGVLIGACTVLSVAVYFALCYFTEKHRIIGGFTVLVFLFIHVQLYLSYSTTGYMNTKETFLEWLLTKGGESGDSTYLWVVYFFFASFFSVTIYYFSNTLYRMFFLTLISLIPAVVYVKVLTDMDNVFLILIASMNVIIFMIHRKRNFQEGENVKQQNTVVSCGIFILLLFLITALIPKNSDTPFYDVFEDAFLGGDTTSALSDSISELSDFSNDAGGFMWGIDTSNRKLYTLTKHGEYPGYIYLKRQVFDLYDYKKKKWFPDAELSNPNISPSEYEESNEYINLANLSEALLTTEKYEPGFLDRYGLGGLKTLELAPATLQIYDIKSENFGAIFYLSPTQGKRVFAEDDSPYFSTVHGAFKRADGPHDKEFKYTIEFYDDAVYRETWLSSGGCDITPDNYSVMLSEMHQVLSSHHDPLTDVSAAFLRLDTEALTYNTLCRKNTIELSDEIYNLAHQVTAGCTYDYEKAMALVNYFVEDGFVYDLSYRAKEKGSDYFLFTSKRGSCSDYATAFTLMARSCGLTVRYAEGYVTEHGDNIYQSQIKSRDSHAYPEVYLANMGWVVFEPTVSRMDSLKSHFSLMHFFTDLKMDYGLVGVILYFIIVGSILLGIARFVIPVILELIFRIRLMISSPEKAVLLAYNKLVRLSQKTIAPDINSKTPYELACLLQSIGCDISKLSFMAEDYLYADKKITSQQKKEIFPIYANAHKALRRFSRTKKTVQPTTELP